VDSQGAIAKLRPEVLAAMDSFDPMSEFLRGTRSSTRNQYRKNLRYFFDWAYGSAPTPELVVNLLSLDQQSFNRLLGAYVSQESEKLSAATINNRIAALSSFLKYSRCQDLTTLTTEFISRKQAEPYRDTSGISLDELAAIFRQCDLSSRWGRRDRVLLLLLWENGLRRAEVSSLDVRHFDSKRLTLEIMGKGRDSRERVGITQRLADEICWMLGDRPKKPIPTDPLFVSYRSNGEISRLSPDRIYKIVRNSAERAGLSRTFSPHRMRHTCISLFLDAASGDTRAAQALSRHKDGNTLAIYDDRRKDLQRGVSERLSELLDSAIGG